MFKMDELILRAYFQLEEYQRQRIRFERLLRPEKMNWSTEIPKVSEAKTMKVEELANMGFGESFYGRMVQGEKGAKARLQDLAASHPLMALLKIRKPEIDERYIKGLQLGVEALEWIKWHREHYKTPPILPLPSEEEQ